jgi:hypothetical protein
MGTRSVGLELLHADRRMDGRLQMHFCNYSLRNSEEGREKERGICNGMARMSILANDCKL